MSLFVDTVATKYFPNTGNPNTGTYRYKLQVRDTCGFYSPLGDFHNTIYISNNAGTFSWPQLYTIENNPNPVTSYLLMRDDSSTGVWDTISSVAGTQQVINDPAYAAYQNVASWRIYTQWSISCTATLVDPGTEATNLNSSKSNICKLGGPTSVNGGFSEVAFKAYPNPGEGKFILTGFKKTIHQIEVYTMLGERIQSFSSASNTVQVDLSSCPEGIYFVTVNTAGGSVTKKLVVAR